MEAMNYLWVMACIHGQKDFQENGFLIQGIHYHAVSKLMNEQIQACGQFI